jgi:hypothetical protein
MKSSARALKWRQSRPFALFMWTYSRQSQFALLTFSDALSVDEAYSAAVEIRDAAGSSPVRVVVDVTEGEISERCVLVFMSVLEEVAVMDLVILGASRAVEKAFQIAWTSFTVPVTFHDTGVNWLSSERRRESIRPVSSIRPRSEQAAPPESGCRPIARQVERMRRAG